ncbi:DUF2235 domain-containing protein [Bauldia litoralis]|uniref:DUF2235 domain-containing protein n=2 Tax=Bauldia litoralis TaxID=665467 RepID=UPI0032663D52
MAPRRGRVKRCSTTTSGTSTTRCHLLCDSRYDCSYLPGATMRRASFKRLVICCDGTWNRLDAAHPTNVVRFAESVSPIARNGVPQIVWYDDGVGSGNTTVGRNLDRWLGGAFGAGLMTKVEQAYRFLMFNYDPGDEIFILGFSRGAYTARSLAGLIRNCGIVERSRARRIHEAITLYRQRDKDAHPDAEKSCALRADVCPDIFLSGADLTWRSKNVPGFDREHPVPLRIAYLGVWDTVGALGLPNYYWISGLFNSWYRFHDAVLSSSVRSARQALALDEHRRAFEPSPWENLDLLNEASTAEGRGIRFRQVWFPGDHSSVGGGWKEEGLSSEAFLWLIDGAVECGLEFRGHSIAAARAAADHRAPLTGARRKRLSLMNFMSRRPRAGPQIVADVSESARKRWQEPANALPEKELYRPQSLSAVADVLD